MKAMIIRAIGGPEVFQLADLPTPAPGPNQVLVAVHAAAVNPIDYKVRSTGALGVKAGSVLGFDVAGVIAAVGPGVKDFAVGQEVFYSPDFSLPGGYAEYNLVDASLVALKPKNLDFVEAASLPLAGMTAWDGLMTRGDLRLGQTVLVTAANGGVGSLAVQIAKAAGAYVLATASTRSFEFVRTLGADRVINYQTEDLPAVIAREVGTLDLVYDCVGKETVSQTLPLMKPCGRIVTIVNPSGQLAEGYRRNVTIHFEFLQRRRSTLDALRTLAERRQIRPLIDSVLPLEQVADAHRKLESGGVRGKIVLRLQ